MTTIGHNNGPTMERGAGWRRYAWKRARAELLPKTLPVEILRMRVRRARELGLDYKTYAGVRASTGRDLIAFLFSSNALRLQENRITPGRNAALQTLKNTGILALIYPPEEPETIILHNPIIDAAGPAPNLTDTWQDIREKVSRPLGTIPRDAVLVIGETHLEREWSAAGRLAGYLSAERFFATR